MAPGPISRLARSLRAWSKLALFLGVVALVGVWVVSTGAYSSIELARDASLGVSEENGLVGIDPATTVTAGKRSKLVTLTNNLDQPVTVTIELVEERSAKLYADGRMRDRTITVRLTPDASETIEIQANNRRSTIHYLITAQGESVNIEFGERSVTVDPPRGPP